MEDIETCIQQKNYGFVILVSEIDPSLEVTKQTTLGQEIDDVLQYIENKQQSVLYKMYTQDEINIFMGKDRLKTDWIPHPKDGHHVSGIKHWHAIEYWIYTEWGYALSDAQNRWVIQWANIDCNEFYVTGGRDSGKSFLGSLLILYSMVFHNEIFQNLLVSLFAGSKEQSETVYETHVIPQLVESKNIKQLLSKYDPIWTQVSERKHQAVKTIEMKLLNGAKLRINPTSTKAARSKHPDVLWFDEAVEAEDVRKGKVISSAVSSLTAGHMMRTLATSTVHKNPLGWFANQVRRGRSMMDRGSKQIFTVNLSEAGVESRPWLSREQLLKELDRKIADDSINEDAEFFGLIAGGQGDVFNQSAIKRMLHNVSPPKYDKSKRIIYGHDPGYGTSLYGFSVWQMDDIYWEFIDGEFWKRGDPKEILERIGDYVKRYGEGEHACDAAATSTIKYLQNEDYDVMSFQLGARPPGWTEMLEEEQQRYNTDCKRIANNLVNDKLAHGHLLIHPAAGYSKPITLLKDDPAVHAGRLLIEQMQTQVVSEITQKPMKGNDDMVDSMSLTTLRAEFGSPLGDVSLAGHW